MKKNVVKEKSFQLAVRIVKQCQRIQEFNREYILTKQLIRSGTAPGALIREAEHAQSKADFIHKMSIGLKEINETLYWLELMKETDYLQIEEFNSLWSESEEILKLLVSIIKTSKKT